MNKRYILAIALAAILRTQSHAQVPLSQGGFAAQQLIDEDNNADHISTADLDGDGDQDVITDLIWYENDGTGGFHKRLIKDDDGNLTTDAIAADLDGDGDQDVVVTTSSATIGAGIDWYENDGQGNFGPQQRISKSGFEIVFTTDLDGDGDTDIVAQTSRGEIRWYENNGEGAFGPERVIPGPSYEYRPYLVEVTDLDGDGDQDVLSFVEGKNTLIWYENDGAGNFASEQLISDRAIGDPLSVYATDLDGDGDQDLLANYNESVAWFENDGQANFSAPQIIDGETAFRTEAIYAADLDGDGDQDVISGSLNKVAWYENNGDGQFGPQQVITTQVDQPTAIYAADLDGDLAPDVLTVTLFDRDLTWYKNLLRTFNVPVVTNLTLINRRYDFNQEVKILEEEDVISLRNEGIYRYAIQAKVFNAGQKFRRVIFHLTAPAGQSITRSEYAMPYSLFGDSEGLLRGKQAYAGNYQLVATPYYINDQGEEVAGQSKTVNFTFTVGGLEAENLRIMDAEDDSFIESLENGDIVRLAPDRAVTILADTRYPQYNSVEFILDGPTPDGKIDQRMLQNDVPYSLFGDIGTDLTGKPLAPGEYQLRVIPYLGKNRDGYAGPEVTVNFTVVEDASANSSSLAYPVPFNETLTLKLGAVDLSQTQIQLVHGYGKVYEVPASQMSQDARGLVLNLAKLPSGPYTVRVMNAGRVQTFRVSKE